MTSRELKPESEEMLDLAQALEPGCEPKLVTDSERAVAVIQYALRACASAQQANNPGADAEPMNVGEVRAHHLAGGRTAGLIPATGAIDGLINNWRQEARRHREAQDDCDDDQCEEWHLHKVDADRYEACADQLEALALPPQGRKPEAAALIEAAIEAARASKTALGYDATKVQQLGRFTMANWKHIEKLWTEPPQGRGEPTTDQWEPVADFLDAYERGMIHKRSLSGLEIELLAIALTKQFGTPLRLQEATVEAIHLSRDHVTALHEIDNLRAQVEQAWRPIETAPVNEAVLVRRRLPHDSMQIINIAYRVHDGWRRQHSGDVLDGDILNWMPLPALSSERLGDAAK